MPNIDINVMQLPFLFICCTENGNKFVGKWLANRLDTNFDSADAAGSIPSKEHE